MNWFSNGFLGAYSDFLERELPTEPENKAETLKQLRIQRYEERQGRVKAAPEVKPLPEKD